MDKDRIKGAARQFSGSVKEVIGRFTGDKKTQAEGTMDKSAGKAQGAAGRIKDRARSAFKK